MMNATTFQLGLFDRPGIARRGKATSEAAAEEIAPRSGTLRGFVLAFVRGRGAEGATDEEIQVGLEMNPSTQRPRRVELIEAGLVVDSGTTRKTKSGRAAVVWRAVSS